MTPSPRVVGIAAALALALLVVPWPIVLLVAVTVAVVVGVDAALARQPVVVERTLPGRLARGVPAELVVTVSDVGARRVEVRQPRVPDVAVEPAQALGGLRATVTATRRGHHVLPPVAVRVTGPLGLARWDQRPTGGHEVDVYPDLPAARRIATAVRQARFRDPGLRRRGAIGLGTDFDQVREHLPDDDIRHVNWPATLRRGRMMTNQYREDTERDVVALVDCGRLMAAPVAGPDGVLDRTRLDVAVDAVAALAAVADVVGDRCGTVAFADEVVARVRPKRSSGEDVVRALHAVEPRPVDSDAELAFRAVGTTKRSLVVVLTDLLDTAAAQALLDAVPVLARRHAVVVASCTDVDVEASAVGPDRGRAAAASRVLAERDRVVAEVTRRGARVVEAPPDRLARSVVAAYLTAKSSARL